MISKHGMRWLLAAVCMWAGLGVTVSAQDAAAPAAAPAAVAAAPAGPAAGLVLKEGAAGDAKPHGASFWEILTRAGIFGFLIWLMLFACSIVSVWLTFDSFVTIRAKKISPTDLVDKVRSSMEQGDVMKAIKNCEDQPCALSEILMAGFSNVQEGFEVVQDAVGVRADLEGEKMLQRVTYLSVVSNTTPMLGLIGTVQGMIMAFATLGTQEAGAAQQAMLAINISHGLWATAVGLTVAVQSTIFFYFFKNKATRHILEMEALTLDLIKTLRNVEVVTE